MKLLSFCIVAFGFSQSAEAACAALANTTLSAGQAGEVRMSVGSTTTFNKMMFCDGSTWRDLPGSQTAVVCAKNGEIYVSGGELYYCNNLFAWAFDSSGGTNGACTATGEMKFNTGTNRVEFCNGANWRTLSSTDTVPDVFTFDTLVNEEVENSKASIKQIIGLSGDATATITLNVGGCTGGSGRVCPNPGCTTTLSSRTTNGTLVVPNGAYFRAAFASAITPSTTCSIDVTIGGVSSTFSVTTAASDTAPTYQTGHFTDAIGQSTSTLVTSNIMKISGHTGITASISDVSTGGSPEFRVCNDATCTSEAVTWGTAPQALTNPQWVQLRTTTTAGLGFRMVSFDSGTANTIYWNVSTGTCPMTATIASGGSLTCTCPAGTPLVAPNNGNLNGVGNYRQSSRFCRAAVHAGAVNNATGGSVTAIGLTAGSPPGTCATFVGGSANGTTSNAGGTAGTSYYFSGFGTNTCN